MVFFKVPLFSLLAYSRGYFIFFLITCVGIAGKGCRPRLPLWVIAYWFREFSPTLELLYFLILPLSNRYTCTDFRVDIPMEKFSELLKIAAYSPSAVF